MAGPQATVLLVEDDADLLEVTQLFLEGEGFIVVPARNGERALKLLERFRPDVILTDLMMPVLDGFGFIKAYRTRPGEPAPVVVVSSLARYLVEARKLGVAAALEKPFDLAVLTDVLRRVGAGQPVADLAPPPPSPELEAARLHTISELQLDQPAPEENLHAFIDQVAAHFRVPIALISVVTEHAQFWTAGCGIPEEFASARGGPRHDSFCTHAVVGRSPLVVQDTRENPLFQGNVFTTRHGIRFYAGVPLVTRHGESIGTLCLLDQVPREFTHADLELLRVLGCCVLSALEWREKRLRPEIPESSYRFLEYLDRELDILGKRAFQELAVAEAARAAERRTRLGFVVLAVPPPRLKQVVRELRGVGDSSFLGRLGHSRVGGLLPGLTAAEARGAAQAVGGPDAVVAAADLEGYTANVTRLFEDLELSLGDAGLA
jgi:CheY-like chemotaxis protein